MSNSSELSGFSPGGKPADQALEDSLRREVRMYFKEGEMSVNYARKLSEESLGLKKDFYINHSKWKAESKRIIKDEVEKQAALPISPGGDIRSSHSPPVQRAIPQEEERPRKKQRTATPSDDDDELSSPPSDLSSEEEKLKKKAARKPNGESGKSAKPPAKKAAAKPQPQKKTKKEPKAVAPKEGTVPESKTKKSSSDQRKKPADDSASELSELIDEDPKPKRRKSKDPSEKTGEKPKRPKVDADEDPDATEIKRLQGWLVKCGIRKLWGKELKPYETPKAKIKHLKEMLAEAGMTGRYSQEKATQIKEQRELAADIEAVQEGAERWGKDGEGSEGEDTGRPARRLVRGSKAYDFLSSDGEETD